MTRLRHVTSIAEIPDEYREGPIGRLLEYHNLERPFDAFASAELLIGMCMDHRKSLRLPGNFAYILRTPGGNLADLEFAISFAIAVGGVRAIAVIGHTQCGMANPSAEKDRFVEGLVRRAGWDRPGAAAHFAEDAPRYEIGDPAGFVLRQAGRLRHTYPLVPVAPLLYRLEDGRLYLVVET